MKKLLKAKDLKGVIPPVVTPIKNQQINFGQLESVVNKLMSTKLNGALFLGSNGEFASMTQNEQFIKSNFEDKLLLAGTGSNSYKETLYMSQKSAEYGFDAVLVIPPYYYQNAISNNSLLKYFTNLADDLKDEIPIILYNMPANTNGIGFSVDLVKKLSEHDNIIGIKDSTGNIVQMNQYVRNTNDFSVFTGSGSTLSASLSIGAVGGINALANIFPNEVCEIYEEFQRGNFEKSFKIQTTLIDINQAVTSQLGVPALKVAMALNGFDINPEVLQPLSLLSTENHAKIKELMGSTMSNLKKFNE